MSAEILPMSKSFKDMTNDELERYFNNHQDDENSELAFLEYSSRLDWNKVPADVTPKEEKQIIENLIAQKSKNNWKML